MLLTLSAFLVTLFISLLSLGLITLCVIYVIDKHQTTHAIRRNFPVIGRFRYWLEELGFFFRQYFYAMDREEMPFNRAERSWVYRAAKNINNTAAFGSTRNQRAIGNVIFANTAFPDLDHDRVKPHSVCFGPYSRQPYNTDKFFNISAMSYGSLSRNAVRALSAGAKQAGCLMNTGEGGVSPYHLEGGAPIIYQLGTAKYGARNDDGSLNIEKLRDIASNPQIKMLELKLAQGAKPGKGGILPAEKVTEEIAKIRGIPVGQSSISPNRHPEISNPDELLDVINQLREISGLPVGIKIVVGHEKQLDTLINAIKKHPIEHAPDFITVDGGDGGTGAAPVTFMDAVGLTIKEALPALVDRLDAAGLRPRIKIIASGKLVNPEMVAWALCAGADSVNSARGFMFALGCIQAMQCNQNSCPTGITTHKEDLQRGLVPENKAERVAHYAQNMEKEVRMIAHSCGVSEPRELRREHVRIVCPDGKSRAMDELYPEKTEMTS